MMPALEKEEKNRTEKKKFTYTLMHTHTLSHTHIVLGHLCPVEF